MLLLVVRCNAFFMLKQSFEVLIFIELYDFASVNTRKFVDQLMRETLKYCYFCKISSNILLSYCHNIATFVFLLEDYYGENMDSAIFENSL